MKLDSLYIPKALGLILCILALTVLTGWALEIEAMVRLVPGSVAMGLNTSLLFLMSGLGLFCSTLEKRSIAFERLSGLSIFLLSSLILSQYIFNVDLGVDLTQIHAAVQDGNPFPGRTAPNTCLAFMFIGLVFLLQSQRAMRPISKPIVSALIAGIIIIGGLASLGYILNLEAMYQIASYNRMAVPTAVAITLLGIALGLHHHRNASIIGTLQNEDKRITKIAAIVLLVVAVTAGLAGFAVISRGFEKSAASSLQNMALSNAEIISDMLDQAILLANSVTTRPALKRYLIKLNINPNEAELLPLIAEVGRSFLLLGITGVSIFDARGNLLTTAGKMEIANATASVVFPPPNNNSTLFWQNGFVLKNESYAMYNGQVIGRFVTEQRLTSLTKLVFGMQQTGLSNDLLLCGRVGNDASCFPTRFYRPNIRIPIFKQDGSPTLPISRALLGGTGAAAVKDLRGIKVLAGYAPLTKFGLGLVVKTDVKELYGNHRDRLNLLIVFLIILVVCGTLVLQRQIQPLVVRMIAERRRIRIILENSNDAFISIGHNGLVTDWNTQAEVTFGWTRAEAMGKDLANLIIPQAQREMHNAGFQNFSRSGTGPVINNRIEVNALHRSGREIPIELSVAAFHDGKGYVANAFLRDITERKRAEKTALFIEKERLRVTLNSIGDAVITTDTMGNVTYLNPIAEVMTGWTNSEAIGLALSTVFNIVSEIDEQVALNPVESLLRNEYKIGLAENNILIKRDGSRLPIEDSAAPIRDSKGDVIGIVLVFRDVSQARKMVAQMTHQATHDSLTGLINRSEFERGLELILRSVDASDIFHTLLYLDLDQFKIVNDTCGHMAGDALLQQLTSVLQKCLRKNDIFARLGGDEFGVLLHSCATQPALQIAEELKQTVSEFHFVWLDKVFSVGVSIGLVTFNNSGISLADILRMADTACYAAKDKGRNRVHVYRVEDKELALRLGEMGWIGRIHKALDEQRFVLYSQKILALGNDSEEGDHYELLLRMWDEEGNLVAPMAFIPAAERYGLMPLLDRWVIKKAFSQYADRHPAGSHLGTCAINLSGTSICDENFLAFVLKQFEHYGVPPQAICFEITETSAIANLTQATALIRELKAIGCRFALDDFGSGMSSFTYLKHLPVDYLKIDGGFVKDMMDDQIDHAMVDAINRIGHVMGLQTIAEFVENDDILEALRKMNVNFAQGYGVEKPQPPMSVKAKLKVIS